jgi:hypothetical protein
VLGAVFGAEDYVYVAGKKGHGDAAGEPDIAWPDAAQFGVVSKAGRGVLVAGLVPDALPGAAAVGRLGQAAVPAGVGVVLARR